jgi:hypothetical protein
VYEPGPALILDGSLDIEEFAFYDDSRIPLIWPRSQRADAGHAGECSPFRVWFL